jgi:hypothetical protein
VQAANVSDATYQPRTVNRYTITAVVNTARARIVPTLVVGQTYAFSCVWKYNGTNAIATSINVNPTKGLDDVTANSYTVLQAVETPVGNGWYYSKYVFTVTATPTGGAIFTYGILTGSDTTYLNQTFDVYNEQFEVQAIVTPYINGTRTNTQALLDLTNNNTITATSLTYVSDNTFSFNGSSNYLELPTNFWSHDSGNPFTVSLFFKTSVAGGTIFGQQNTNTPSSSTGYVPAIYIGTDGLLRTSCFWGGSTTNHSTSSSNVATNTWQHITVTFASGTQKSYLNGELYATLAKTQTNYSPTYYFFIGAGQAGAGWPLSSAAWFFNGSISAFSFYNRELSAAEVKQNFEALRSRFGI